MVDIVTCTKVFVIHCQESIQFLTMIFGNNWLRPIKKMAPRDMLFFIPHIVFAGQQKTLRGKQVEVANR